jgi:hypothetical protein
MKVKLLCSRVSPSFSQNAGDEIEVEDDEGLRMIEAGQCVPASKKETASAKNISEKATAK